MQNIQFKEGTILFHYKLYSSLDFFCPTKQITSYNQSAMPIFTY